MKTEDYLRQKLRLLYISLALNILGTLIWLTVAIVAILIYMQGGH